MAEGKRLRRNRAQMAEGEEDGGTWKKRNCGGET